MSETSDYPENKGKPVQHGSAVERGRDKGGKGTGEGQGGDNTKKGKKK